MTKVKIPVVAVIDIGFGNLFSVKNACEYVGMKAILSSSRKEILESDAVILPGVGAFGDAMKALNELSLIPAINEIAEQQKPLIGICLGMQILMSEGTEFGKFEGLDLISGTVERLDNPKSDLGFLKVPEICWNRMYRTNIRENDSWLETPLTGLADGVFMYFNHSFYVKPDADSTIISKTRYGNIEFCSAIKKGNIFGIQAHPERSGNQGLQVYKNIAHMIECSL